MDYIGTFWVPTEYGKSTGLPSFEIYAVVASHQSKKDSCVLKAWKLENRGCAIYHPAYGIIPCEYCEKYDFFILMSERARPDYEFNSNSSKYKMIASNMKEFKKVLCIN
jgi:hypothetical protein